MKAHQIDVNSDICADDTSAVIQAHESNLIVKFTCKLKEDYDVEYYGSGDIPNERYHPTFDASVTIVSIHAALQESIKALVDMSSIESEWLDEMIATMEKQIKYNARQAAAKDAA